MLATIRKAGTTSLIITIMLIFQTALILPYDSDHDILVSSQEGDEDDMKAVAWKPIAPLQSATFIGYDGVGFDDDFAFMAAIPTGVFQQDGSLYSSPVLFYTPPHIGPQEEETLNSYKGLEYFMEDWNALAEMERVQLIGIPDDQLDSVKALAPSLEYQEIQVGNPYATASKIARENWEYSDIAVIAVIDGNLDLIDEITTGTITDTIPAGERQFEHFEGEKSPDPSEPTFHDFTNPEGYKWVVADMEWAQYGNPTAPGTERGRDPDLQLYDWQIGEVSASENWNVLTGNTEHCESYGYHAGEWAAAVTYMPTESLGAEEPDDDRDLPWQSGITTTQYEIDITKYPGVDIPVPDIPGPMTRNGAFTLEWDGNINLGLIVRGPSGAEIATAMGTANPKTINLRELGNGEYSIAVILLEDSNAPIDFTVEYTWEQTRELSYAQAFEAAANGAVLASMKNAPLLYTKKGSLPDTTKETLDTLGVTTAYLVAPGGEKGAAEDIEDYRSFYKDGISVTTLDKPREVYQKIRSISQENDIIFTTVNPWSYWHVDTTPFGEEMGGLYVGPAALAGAFHGAPVIVTDAHSPLSAANAWHNVFWLRAAPGRLAPSVACMVLTARAVYAFIDDMGLNGTDQESILTVAAQFDIGTAWDRALVGAAFSGRINGSPTDASYWVSRSALYPLMIFANPGVAGEVTMEQGTDIEKGIGPGHMIDVQYPVLQSWVSYQHRFNDQASMYWGTNYETADGIVPFETPSDNPIDDDCNGDYKSGQFWPDLTVSEVVPFYAEKAGYESVYSTNFDITMENLNKGTIMWLEIMHGGQSSGRGVVGFWYSDGQLERNPWRGYDGEGGSTLNPDSVAMDKNTGADLIPLARDGVVICIAQQFTQTTSYNGYDFDAAMGNIHSAGFSAGSCLIANTLLHLSMVRHGGVFQIIDPWLTSWYVGFAIETFVRDIALGDTVGEAYAKSIGHVGILYLTNQWWWDIFENVVYYGDPDLRVFSPEYAWEQPAFHDGSDVGGHAVNGADEHPNEIETNTGKLLFPIVVVVVIASLAVYVYFRKSRLEVEWEVDDEDHSQEHDHDDDPDAYE